MTPTQPYRTTLLFLVSFLVPLLLAAVACDAISNKPSTSISGDAYDSRSDLRAACQEGQREIDDWEERETQRLLGEFAESGGDFFGSEGLRMSREGTRMEEEADAMRDELRDNCQAEADRVFDPVPPWDPDSGIPPDQRPLPPASEFGPPAR